MSKKNSLVGRLCVGLAGIFLLFAIGSCEKEKSVTGPTASVESETAFYNAATSSKCDNIPLNQQCVAYIKEQKPEYNFYWGGSAYMIWYHQKVVKKGYYPEVGSVMVLGPWSGNNYGHVGIVRKKGVSGYNLYVYIDHRNWNCDGKIITNDLFIIDRNTVKRIPYKRNGKSYPLLGFIYELKK